MAHLRLVLPETGSDFTRIFTVEWNNDRQKFLALDDQGDVLGSFPNQSNAIGIAIRDAKLASRTGYRIAFTYRVATDAVDQEELVAALVAAVHVP